MVRRSSSAERTSRADRHAIQLFSNLKSFRENVGQKTSPLQFRRKSLALAFTNSSEGRPEGPRKSPSELRCDILSASGRRYLL